MVRTRGRFRAKKNEARVTQAHLCPLPLVEKHIAEWRERDAQNERSRRHTPRERERERAPAFFFLRACFESGLVRSSAQSSETP